MSCTFFLKRRRNRNMANSKADKFVAESKTDKAVAKPKKIKAGGKNVNNKGCD